MIDFSIYFFQLLQFYVSLKETLFLFIFLVLIILWIRWRKKKLKIFEELGIPGPPPHFLFGNILEINEKGILQCQNEWLKKYGKFVGYFNGLNPVLLVADQATLKRIFIKDFNLFSDRPEVVPLRVHSVLDHIIPASQIMDNLLLNKKGENWKRIRSKLSPVFSANKLKMMIPAVDKVTEVTLSILEEKAQSGDTIDIYTLLQYLTLDIICAQAFAVHTNVQREGSSNQLFRSAKTVFDNPSTSKVLIFGFCFPELGILGMMLNFLKMFFENGLSIPPLKITNLVGKVIEQRRKNPQLRQLDILQSLIDASNLGTTDLDFSNTKKNSDLDSESDNALNQKVETLQTKDKERRGLSDLEIKASALVVFLAGYETTSSALAYIFYMLTRHPEYQVEIQKEIDRNVQGKEFDYNTLNSLQLMERFMKETMRFYPPGVVFVNRIATEDIEFGYLHIPKGMLISVPVNYMHLSEDNWENPEMFYPDRFLLENRNINKLMNYWVFGIGPRNCIGMRLANITSKIVLMRLLQKFSFEKPDDPKEASMTLTVKQGTMVPNQVFVRPRLRLHASKES